MNDITERELREHREEAERTRDDSYPPDAPPPRRPGHARGKVLSVRLNPEEYDALTQHATHLELPPSTLVRGWILTQLQAETETSPAAAVDRLARDVEQLRRQIVSAA